MMELSICMITYNHEKYIEEAINSVLMQDIDFSYELVISNDASTDNTHSIITNIIRQHPKAGIIKYFNHPANIGMRANFEFALEKCAGKYVAICEGDDYWTDPYKLQKQVDFLEANELYALCFHQTITKYEDGAELLYNNFTGDSSFNFIDLVQRPFISTVSSVFRNPNPLPEWFADIASDWPLFLHVASHGKIYYMNESMAVYRRHSEGVWSSLSNDARYNNTIGLLDKLDKIFSYEYHDYFEKSKQARYDIHYPPAPVIIKRSLLTRIKSKLKAVLLSR